MSESQLSTRRVFIQYLNPEILALYGWNHRELTGDLYRRVMILTVYALLFSTDSLIMPASYLFEVGFIERFLKDVDSIRAEGILQFASPAANLDPYAKKKKQEYRDELSLFPNYKKRSSTGRRKQLVWVPRTKRSSSADIAVAWRAGLYEPDGIWRQIIASRSPQLSLLPSRLETEIESVPDKLENRAFIQRYAQSALPIRLDVNEQTETGMLISRAYLQSYLEEFDAVILTDTSLLGNLSCGLPATVNGRLRTFSFRTLRQFFHAINLSNYVEHGLSWKDLIELRNQFVFRWLMNLLVHDTFDTSRPLERAILESRFDIRTAPARHAARRPVITVLDHLDRLFAAVRPVLRSYCNASGNVLDNTMPMETRTVIRIVVASPDDAESDQRGLAEVIAELNRGIAAELRLLLELSSWRTDAFPGFHRKGPQGLIDSVLRIEDCDVLIGIFWKRFGTATADGLTGTEHEIRQAYEAWKEHEKPQLMIYFKDKPYTPVSKAETDQWGRVLEFKNDFPREGLWWSYRNKSHFEKLVRNHLTQFVRHVRG